MAHMPPRSRWASTLLLAIASLPAGGAVGQEQPHRDGLGEMDFALLGDAIITRRLSVFSEPEYVELRAVIRNAAVAFANLEINLIEYDDPGVIPKPGDGQATYMRGAPEMADELVWMGLDLVSFANNHAGDFGVGGLRANKRRVEAVGLVGSGVGENLAEARAPAYLETPGGRVALISVSTTYEDYYAAGRQRPDFRGRPGLNPLGSSTIYDLPASRFEQLSQIQSEGRLRGSSTGDELSLLGSTFRRGSAYRTTTIPDPRDLAEILASVRDARRQANWVIVSVHTHQSGATRFDPPDFVREAAHAVIDAGADMWVGHGPHILRGIEVYEGRPIFYSLGNFMMENETPELQAADNYEAFGLPWDALPSDYYDARIEASPTGSWPGNRLFWESVVAVPRFSDGRLTEIRLHPITLGFGLARPQRGRPLAAKGELARKIIGDLQRLSEVFGTRIEFENGIGVVRLPRGVNGEQP